ncbi:MAG: hypothetical protein L0219_16535 [Phycisphaerales bacterium]|nr:hypothetical protein [Phycisphaerales bacterium]MCI0674268.1 hypothetical protein [Phycisphaerales bacterium]
MNSDVQELLTVFGVIFAVLGSIAVLGLLFFFVAIPLFRGLGSAIGYTIGGIGWFFAHIFEFIGGMLGDTIRFMGGIIACLVLMLLVPLNIIIGRWSAAGHFAEAVKRECSIGSACLYRVLIRRPLKLLMLHGLLEGLEQRVPEAMHGAPGSDSPSRRLGQFDGYTITGSLRAGGSGAKLYIAAPEPAKRRKLLHAPDQVVIKCFALTEGSSLPQIVRESRALECAKQLGHVLDHGMDEHRFFYVMPYHPGDHLGILTRQMHGECGGRGLDQKRLSLAMSYVGDLLETLWAYHQGGLWHKDVKPENVIIHDGRAHLVDLGLVTPLRSAMTLTTHGTEYFRDPEMVRQALRGVKVHQVNGAKFDIYAAGAVLYFMIENTFPAHGGLSRFVTPSPEALRWIIRRAMTEYNQRYSTADQMLADLRHVMAASDAFAVKPADLPSMRGVDAPMPEVHVVNATGMSNAAAFDAVKAGKAQAFAVEPALEGYGIAAGIGTAGAFAQVGRFKLDAAGNPIPLPPSSPRAPRPRLKVTNWWTGQYQLEQPLPGDAAPANINDEARAFRKHAYAFRQQAHDLNRQARVGAMSARKAAREQIKAARQRAREIRGRALTHRHRVVRHARTSPWVVALGTLSLLVVVGLLALAFVVTTASSRLDARVASSNRSARPLLLALDAPDLADPRLRQELERCIAEQRRRGYDVVAQHDLDHTKLVALVRKWSQDKDKDADAAIEDLLANQNAYGVLYVRPIEGRNRMIKDVESTIIHSEKPGAAQRRRPAAPAVPPAPAQPYLLINDHPTKADADVAARIEQILKSYRSAGWTIQTDDDAEVQVRKYLPTGPVDPKIPLSPLFHSTLANAKFGGVFRIDAKPGDAPAHQRVYETLIEVDPSAECLLEGESSSTASHPQSASQGHLLGAGNR